VLEGNNIDGSTMSPEPDTPQTDAMDIISSSGFDFSSLFEDDGGVQQPSGAPALHTLEHIGQFIIQCGEASTSDIYKLRLFLLSLSGAALLGLFHYHPILFAHGPI